MSARVPAIETTVTCPDCGYTNTGRTPALAARALNRHSCATQAIKKRQAQFQENLKTSQGEVKDCQCKTVKHEHGTLQAYKVDGCGCRPCRNANRDWANDRARKIAYGTWDSGRTDAQPVREHITMLIANGVSDRTLADVSGVGRSTIRTILHGRRERGGQTNKTTTKGVAERILAVHPTMDVLGENCMIDITGTRRRIQALVAIGWPLSRIAAQLGISAANINTLLNQPTVRVRTALKVRDVYDRTWNRLPATASNHEAGAVKKAIARAAGRGWVPPLAWDDDTIDDPATVPDTGEKLKLRDTIADDVEFLHNTGASRDEIADRLNTSWETIERQLYRIDRSDIITLVKTDTRDNARQARKGHAA